MNDHKTVLISGATGTIGRSLIRTLHSKGFKVHALSRKISKIKNAKVFLWDIEKSYIDTACFENVGYILHLAGEGIADKNWSAERKKQIIDSRVKGAELLYQATKQNKIKLEKFITASAVGYFGADADDKIYNEDDKPANDFLGECCVKWELAADLFNDICPVVKVRLAVVLDKKTGAFPKLILPIKFGIASALGSGKQSMAWIHVKDAVQIFYNSIVDPSIVGIYIAASPQHQSNESFTKIVAKVMKRPFFLPNVPSLILKTFFGEMSDVLLHGQNVYPKRLIAHGYKFEFEDLEKAIIDLRK